MKNEDVDVCIDNVLEAVRAVRSTKNLFGITRNQLPKVILTSNNRVLQDLKQCQTIIKILSPCSEDLIVTDQDSDINLDDCFPSEIPEKNLVAYVNVKGLVNVSKEKERIEKQKKKIGAQLAKLEGKVLKDDYDPESGADDRLKDQERLQSLREEDQSLNSRGQFLNRLQ